jgi:hypothetical protein
MFDELARADYPRAGRLFTGLPFFLVIDAALAGNMAARVWVDDADLPQSVLMWDTRHGYYLAGSPAHSAFNRAAGRWVGEQVARGPFYAKIHFGSPDWESVVPLLFGTTALTRAERVIFALNGPRIEDWAERVPPGFRIARIDVALLSRSGLANLHLVMEEISSCWNSVDDFLAAGFGFCTIRTPGPGQPEEIVCWCTAECVSERKLGIGIETVAAYQGRGVATLTAAAFVQECRARGMAAHWDAFQSNGASLAVAWKVGFEPVGEYAVFLAKTH